LRSKRSKRSKASVAFALQVLAKQMHKQAVKKAVKGAHTTSKQKERKRAKEIK
jgi:hypothetical protein